MGNCGNPAWTGIFVDGVLIMENTLKRQANIELLRVVAMLMIIGSHLALHGIQADMGAWNAGNRINRIFTSMLKPGGCRCSGLFYNNWLV